VQTLANAYVNTPVLKGAVTRGGDGAVGRLV
jgi:hypothetical protein